jgi:hypothetical protein
MSSNQVPKGYEQKDVGVIPKAWGCITIGTIQPTYPGSRKMTNPPNTQTILAALT